MERVEIGMFARSKAGHDKGKLYIILRTEGEYVYLTDGRLRPMSNPKKKEEEAYSAYVQDTRRPGPDENNRC